MHLLTIVYHQDNTTRAAVRDTGKLKVAAMGTQMIVLVDAQILLVKQDAQ